MEPSVTVRCRQADQALVQAAIPRSVEAYKSMSKLNCQVTLDTSAWLAPTM